MGSIEAFLLEKLITIPSPSKTTQVCVPVPGCAPLVNHIPYRQVLWWNASSDLQREVRFFFVLWILTSGVLWGVDVFLLNAWLD